MNLFSSGLRLLLVAVLLGGAPLAASALDIGAVAPKWTNLAGVDDKQHSLDDLKDAKAVVVVFTCNHCPVAVAYEDRLIQLTRDYQNKGVAVVAINVNNLEEDKLPAMKRRAQSKGFNFPYLYDPTQLIGRAYGATVTPHVFLLDGERKLAYKGAIDDNMNADKVSRHYLREAIDAVLAGKPVATATTQQRGCSIKYEGN
jgi:peroxiredoxin